MYSTPTYRAFLLKMADADTEAAIEDGILDGSIDPVLLEQVEDELIDDYLFGRLSEEELIHFASDFLSTSERKDKLKFASALQKYSVQKSLAAPRFAVFSVMRRFPVIPWSLPLAGALACTLTAAAWLAESNLNYRRELAQSKQDSDERQRLIASLQQDQKRADREIAASATSLAQTSPSSGVSLSTGSPRDQVPKADADLPAMLTMRLSSGVSRGLTAVPLLHLGKQANLVSFELELPFNPQGVLHEELLNSESQPIWSQQFSNSDSIAPHGVTTVLLPAALLAKGDYRIKLEFETSRAESIGKATYLFRVRRD